MALDVGGIRDGLETRLATITGLRTYDVVPANPQVPAAVVAPDDPFVDYLQAMQGGLVEVRFAIVLLVRMSTDRGWQDALDSYLSAGTGETSSVFDAIRGDKTLGGVAFDCVPRVAGGYGTETFGTGEAAIDYGTVRIDVSVYANRK
jgi:hypothetical protein